MRIERLAVGLKRPTLTSFGFEALVRGPIIFSLAGKFTHSCMP